MAQAFAGGSAKTQLTPGSFQGLWNPSLAHPAWWWVGNVPGEVEGGPFFCFMERPRQVEPMSRMTQAWSGWALSPHSSLSSGNVFDYKYLEI